MNLSLCMMQLSCSNCFLQGSLEGPIPSSLLHTSSIVSISDKWDHMHYNSAVVTAHRKSLFGRPLSQKIWLVAYWLFYSSLDHMATCDHVLQPHGPHFPVDISQTSASNFRYEIGLIFAEQP